MSHQKEYVYKLEIHDDPNEPEQDRYYNDSCKKDLHKDWPINKLERKLKKHSYYKCQIKKTHWTHGEAIVLNNCGINVIHLPTSRSCGRAFDGDIVVVKKIGFHIYDEGNKQVYGEVKGILERKENLYEKKFVCRIDDNNSSYMIPIDDNNIRFFVMSPSYHKFKSDKIFLYKQSKDSNGSILIKEKNIKGVTANNYNTHRTQSHLFLVRYIKWSKKHYHPYGYVEAEINPDSLKVYRIICKVPQKHNERVCEDAKLLITQKGKPKIFSNKKCARKDLTELFSFTIDGNEAKILDDAFSIECCNEHEDCWEIGIHIADVASVVPEDSDVDVEAKERFMSFIETSDSRDSEGWIFPKELAMQCSLNKDEERFAVSTFFHSSNPPINLYNQSENDEECMSDFIPFLSKIKSKHKLSYKQAQRLLNQRFCGQSNLCESPMLADRLYQLWKVMWAFRVRRLDTAAFYKNTHNEQYGSDFDVFRQECMARILVEEAMITLNAFIAQLFKANKVSFLARTQPPPRPEAKWMFSSLSLYQTSCHSYYKADFPGSENQKEKLHDSRMVVSKEVWDVITSSLRNNNVEEAVFLACCDDFHSEMIVGLEQYKFAQEKAVEKYYYGDGFTEENEFFHFSLRVALYLRCSSPIRRYEDLVAQRSLIALLRHETIHYEWDRMDIAKSRDVEDRVVKFQEAVAEKNFSSNFVSTYFEGYVVAANDFSVTFKFPSLGAKFDINISEIGSTRQIFDYSSKIKNHSQYKLEWTLRYYDISLQQDFMGAHHKKQRDQFHMLSQYTVSTDKWKSFLASLRSDCTLSGDTLEVADALQSVADSLVVKDDCDFRYTPANKTSNGIVHGRKTELAVKPFLEQSPTTPLFFQLAVGLEQSMKSLVPQLFYLTPNVGNSFNSQCEKNLEICLSHRRHVTMFDINYVTPKDKQVLKEFEKQSKKLFLYYSEWISLVRMDGVYSSVHSNSSILIQLEDVVSGQFSLGNLFCDVCFVSIRKGDFICLRKKTRLEKTGKFNTWVGHGVITDVEEKKELETSLFSFKIFESIETGRMPRKDGPITCEVIPLSVSHRRMANALFGLTNANMLLYNICIGNDFSTDLMTRDCPESIIRRLGIGNGVIGKLQSKLNKKQAEQVNKALRHQVTLIQGPPGTGKSFMGAHLAYYFCQLNKRLSKEGKVLYCGPSNKSVDVVAEYLQKIPSLRVARVCGSMLEELDFPIPIKPAFDTSDLVPINSSLRSVALHHVIRQDGKPFAAELKKFDDKFQTQPSEISFADYDEYRDILAEAKECELDEVDVVLSTCVVAGSKLLSKLRYAQCIIDECGMCSEPESLIPIVTATKRDNFDDYEEDNCDVQVTLIGDHKQLQPIVTCHAAGKGGLEKSMFERLQRKAEKLTIQYRMHETISQFPSKQFYDNELVTDVSVKSRTPGVLRFPLSNENNTAVFCHVSGWEEEDESKSKFNLSQVTVVTKVLSYLLIKNSVKPTEIMVLSPYLAQCREMKKAVGKHKTLKRFYDQLHIGSVATSQGSETDYVILSTVRSSAVNVSQFVVDRSWLYKNIGFVTDDHQINVALTRAKLGLCVIGNEDLLVMHPTWNSLIHEYRKRGAVMQEADVDKLWKIS